MESSLESYWDPCPAQDDLSSTGPQLYTPMSPFDTELQIQAAPSASFSSHLDQSKELSTDFSSVDLSFLPDDLNQDNGEHPRPEGGREMEREEYSSQSTEQDSGFLNGSNLSHLSYADATQPSPETSGACPPLTPMTPITPMTPVSESSGIVPQLQNIVSTVNLACKLDLKNIALHARNAEYNPKRFAAVIMRIREPRTTALIFSSGKMVCTGAKSEEQSRLAARKYARVVQKLGFPAKFLDFKIQNMVGSCDVRFPIRLEGLVLTHQQFSSYEPELFPGLIYRMVKPRIVLLIFVSGKVVLTGQWPLYVQQSHEVMLAIYTSLMPPDYSFGCHNTKKDPHKTTYLCWSIQQAHKGLGAKERSEIYEAFENIYPILKGFKKAS